MMMMIKCRLFVYYVYSQCQARLAWLNACRECFFL